MSAENITYRRTPAPGMVNYSAALTGNQPKPGMVSYSAALTGNQPKPRRKGFTEAIVDTLKQGVQAIT